MSKAKQQTVEEAPKFIDPKEAQEKALEAQRIKENKLVRGVFTFHEVRGGELPFVYRKFKKDGVRNYTLVDGQIYELPLGVAKHLNKSGKYPIHQHTTNKDGKTVESVGRMEARYSFSSLDFIDTSDPDSLATMGRDQVEEIKL